MAIAAAKFDNLGRSSPGFGIKGASAPSGEVPGAWISPTTRLFTDQYGTSTVREASGAGDPAWERQYGGGGGGSSSASPESLGGSASPFPVLGGGGVGAAPSPALEGLQTGFKPLGTGAQVPKTGQSEGSGAPMSMGMEPGPGFIETTGGVLRGLGRRSPPQLSMVLAGLKNIY